MVHSQADTNPVATYFTLNTAEGIELFVYRWNPAGTHWAVVQIVHGLAEHAGRYARLAQELNAAGYAVYANDHRGHGRTAKSAEELGFLPSRMAGASAWTIFGS